MCKSRWIIAFGLAIAGSLQAQQIESGTTAENQPRHEESTADAAYAGESQQQKPVDFTSLLEGIETAIRDLIAGEDKIAAQAQKDRENRYLQAQESMARNAMWMFYATAANVLLTFAALIAIIKTLHQTKRAAVSSEEMLKKAEKATTATFEVVKAAMVANAASAKVVKIDQRPWVHAEIAEFQSVEVDTIQHTPRVGSRAFSAVVILRVINSGKTPAQGVEVWVDAFNDDQVSKAIDVAVIPKSEKAKYRLIGVVPPNSERQLDFPISRSFDDMPMEDDFAFQTRLFCSIRYSTDPSLRDNRDAHTLQTFVIEGFDGGQTSFWINTKDVRLSRLDINARPAVRGMT